MKNDIQKELEKLNSNISELLSQQRERIFSLREENAKLSEELKIQKEREREISQAILSANQKKRETEEYLSVKRQLEINRLKEFSKNWQSHFEKLFAMLPDDKNLQKIHIFNMKLNEILSVEKSPANIMFENEKKRLAAIEKKPSTLDDEIVASENKEAEASENEKGDVFPIEDLQKTDLPNISEILEGLL